MIAVKKVCDQEGCSHFKSCPFALDRTKCKHALATWIAEREIEEID